ncbi:hypothetical protein HY605_03320, partial [Candidatus Peregrinibacteria bacterium]|nr:hypothetical protein [Candidatus Peregrinibacteria bacterium]
RQTTTESVDSNFIYLHGAIIRGRCLLKDDSSVNISPDMYREFVEPYNKRIFEKAGNGGIHSCGNRDHWRECFLETPGVMSLDFGDPQMNDMERWYDDAKAKKIAIPRFVISEKQLFNKSFRDRFRTGVSFFMDVNTLGKAQDLFKKYLSSQRN